VIKPKPKSKARDPRPASPAKAKPKATARADEPAPEGLAPLTRQQIRQVWEAAKIEGADIAALLREHPEYADLEKQLNELPDEVIEAGGASPVVHATFHQLIESQLAANEPTETRQTLEALLVQGITRHEAVHRIAAIYSQELYPVLAKRRDFDQPGYERKLRQLAHQDNATRKA
jgi:hypothetical protein